jgi:hypothetical protein
VLAHGKAIVASVKVLILRERNRAKHLLYVGSKELAMSEDIKNQVDTNSTQFKLGVEAGLNSAVDSNNWQAGNDLGQELKNDVTTNEPVPVALFKEPSPPLFLADSSEGEKGNPQDEKDETEE